METLNENEFFIKGKYHADLFVRLLHRIELKNIPDKIKDPIMLKAKKEKDYLYYLAKHLDNFFPPNKFAILLIDISLPDPKLYILFTKLLFATFTNALIKSST